MFLILKWNKKYLPWSSLLRLLSYFCHFSPSLNTKILYKIDSLANLAASPPSFPYHLHFLVMSSPIFRFYSHCCAATAHVAHISGFLIVKASDFQSSFHQLVEFTDKIQNSQLNASFGCLCACAHTHTYIYNYLCIIYLKCKFNWIAYIFIIKLDNCSKFSVFQSYFNGNSLFLGIICSLRMQFLFLSL